MTTDYLSPLESYVATKAGQPYLWMPFGVIKKGNKTREVTPELASQFKLPHFKPPIKLGSHEEVTPAGGHIVGFEVRGDGIWVTPELVPNGEKSLQEGAYRYHSPEVIWEDGTIQNPTTGEMMKGPFIMGDALLHTPHLGESAALYTYETGEQLMETVSVPKDWFTAVLEKIGVKPEAPKETIPIDPTTTEQYKAVVADAEKYKMELERFQSEGVKTARIDKFSAELKASTKVAEGNIAEVLASLSDEQATVIMTQFKALSAQIDESALLKNTGKQKLNDGSDANPVALYDAAVKSKMVEAKVSYNAAAELVNGEKPELFAAYAATLRVTGAQGE